MRFIPLLLASVAVAVLAIGVSPTSGTAAGRASYGFVGTLSGFPTGSAFLSGGGSYDPFTASNDLTATTIANTAGGFRCTSDVAQGPLNGCLAGQGVRWDTAHLLASTTFKCNGASDTAHTVVTDNDTIVLRADFYRAGDGNDESFADVPMFVSDHDERPDLPGIQNIWIAGVGCGDAVVSFN